MQNIPRRHFVHPLFIVICICFWLCGCSSSHKNTNEQEPPVFSPPRVLTTEAPGEHVIGSPPLTLDVSCTDQGYFTAIADADSTKMNIQLTSPDGAIYSYFVEPGEQAVIPFTSGNGDYQIICYQQISGSQYSALYSELISVTMENIFLPFLYPNQYVNFSPDSEASALALSMFPEDTEDIKAVEEIYNYVIGHVTYDYEKAENVEAGYLPDIDETLSSGKGICFDYAALMAAMLRSLDIPCKLQIGYAGTVKHAWIDVYIRSKGWVNSAISFDGETWTRMDPTFESGSDDKDAIRNYIGDGANYTLQFTR